MVSPFRVDVPDAVLADLRERLARTRWPAQLDDAGWGYGTELSYLQQLCEYWHDEFDWRAAEARINEWPQFETAIDGERMHFIHARSPHPDALPLLVTHGWPGSIVEFLDVLGPLTDPTAHGGDAADAFHVVCPSMPGYGWSGPTHQQGWDIRRVAEAEAALMAELGYDRYGAQGGDWGAIATTLIGVVDPEHAIGLHLNMVVAGPPGGEGVNPLEGLSDSELAALDDMNHFREEETGYQAIQGTKPQTLGYGLTDSPAGLAGWIVEKFRTWSDCGGDVESSFTKDQLLTNITAYWVTNTIASSVRLYCESQRSRRFGPAADYIDVPTGAAIFPKELYRPPRAWAEAAFNIVHWTEMPRGGHFAAMEEPDLLVDDVRSFFRLVR